jgi:hypothetical protein
MIASVAMRLGFYFTEILKIFGIFSDAIGGYHTKNRSVEQGKRI